MYRHELTDAQWALIEPLLPQNEPKKGRPWNDHRPLVNGMVWILHTGAPWRDLPERYGPWQTVYDRFNRWSKDGTWDRVLEALQVRLDERGRIDWDLWCIDGSNVRASKAAAGAGKKGGLTSPRTTRWAARAADSVPSSTWLRTARASRSPSR
jgi:transposase